MAPRHSLTRERRMDPLEARRQREHAAREQVMFARRSRKRQALVGRGAGDVDPALAYEVSRQAYQTQRAVNQNPRLEFIAKTPTAIAYRDKQTNRLLIGIRGTVPTSPEDLAADAAIPLNRLSASARYRKDSQFVSNVLSRFPTIAADVTGHSLGGAIASQLKRDFPGRIVNVETFNQAVQPQDILTGKNDDITRRYMANDPLYKYTGGQFSENTQLMEGPGTGHGLAGFANQVGSDYRDPTAGQQYQAPSTGVFGKIGNTLTSWAAKAADTANMFGVPGAGKVSNSLYNRMYGGGRKRKVAAGKRRRVVDRVYQRL